MLEGTCHESAWKMHTVETLGIGFTTVGTKINIFVCLFPASFFEVSSRMLHKNKNSVDFVPLYAFRTNDSSWPERFNKQLLKE